MRWDPTTQFWLTHLTAGEIIFLNCHLSLRVAPPFISLNRKPSPVIVPNEPHRVVPFALAKSDPHPLLGWSSKLESQEKRKQEGAKITRSSFPYPSVISSNSSSWFNPLMVTRSWSRIRNACWHSTIRYRWQWHDVPWYSFAEFWYVAERFDLLTFGNLEGNCLNATSRYLYNLYNF